MQLEILNCVSLLFVDMVQLEQYEASPSASVEPDAHVEVICSKNIVHIHHCIQMCNLS